MQRIVHRQQLANVLLWTFVLVIADSLQAIASPRSCRRSNRGLSSTSSKLDDHNDFECKVSGEIVGASGRMGSFFLKNGSINQNNSILVAVPRGVAPGCLSPNGTPILVTTPSHAWSSVLHDTIPKRQTDLAFVGNGLPLDSFENCTFVIPHYGVLEVGGDPVTTPLSPPTLIYGKHSSIIQQILEEHGVATKISNDWGQVRVAAARKLLWAACMWLFCHRSSPPTSVSHVHKVYRKELEKLVQELSPVLQELTGESSSFSETLKYMEKYSLSMPNAIPSKELALGEVQERNGVWLRLGNKFPQPFHEELLKRVGVSTIPSQATSPATTAERTMLELNDVGLTVWGVKDKQPVIPCQHVVVIGSGIIGSCMALNLARQGVNVTVYDRLPPKENVGATTAASWAWINANGKIPQSYELLNQLGLRSWKYDGTLTPLPVWSGSLVAFDTKPNHNGGYHVEGPLSAARIKELEPQVEFSSSRQVYFYPQEGSVNPSVAVKELRKAATDLGVTFIANEQVVDLIRDNKRRCVSGVVTRSITSNATSENSCDVVVVAAGAGSSNPAFGGLPLLHRPGQSVFCRTKSSSKSQSPRLNRILVDTVRKAHVLQRRDGIIAVGGGVLETGGSPTTKRSAEVAVEDSLLQGASALTPRIMHDLSHSWLQEANRPIPKDGLPSVGWIKRGLYGIVTHSGVTLAPLLCALASVEVTKGISWDILKPYRPDRFLINQDGQPL